MNNKKVDVMIKMWMETMKMKINMINNDQIINHQTNKYMKTHPNIEEN